MTAMFETTVRSHERIELLSPRRDRSVPISVSNLSTFAI